MKQEDLEHMQATIEMEGFDYAFMDYSDFTEFEDKKFHELRKAYIKTRKALAKYLKIEY